MTNNWEATWQRITDLQGETFRQKLGKPFTYEVRSGTVRPSTTNRMLPRSHFEQAYRPMPLDGPGRIQRLQGPSYIWAILNDPRVMRGDAMEPTVRVAESVEGKNRAMAPPPGTVVDPDELRQRGFSPLDLEILDDVELPFGQSGVNWNTKGTVPDSPGLYLFTVETDEESRVTYVGMTTHLWMVTKGRLPNGETRGGQRYGRPKHAGTTRTRINSLIADQIKRGRLVRHWVAPIADENDLRILEEDLIRRWNLRLAGWNRG